MPSSNVTSIMDVEEYQEALKEIDNINNDESEKVQQAMRLKLSVMSANQRRIVIHTILTSVNNNDEKSNQILSLLEDADVHCDLLDSDVGFVIRKSFHAEILRQVRADYTCIFGIESDVELDDYEFSGAGVG